MTDRIGTRRAGLLVPLFACPSSASWGIGEIGDLPTLAAWLAAAGLRVLQLLPINEMAPGQQSPYSAISAMAIDPIFITVPSVPEFAALGGEAALGDADRAALDRVRGAGRIDYAGIRQLKRSALRRAFSSFLETDWCRDTPRCRQLKAFLSEQAWWVEDYALFRAIHAREGERPWTQWPAALQRREPAEIDHARRELSREVLFHQYLQWIADKQWKDARARMDGVQLFGDLPFMVDGDSADVWSRQDQFRLDASLGVPPDAFSATGQDWGMPVYRWDVIASQGFRWLRERARRSADLYDGYRVDHLVGFYRTYGRPRDGGEPFFTPAHQGEQEALGEYVLGILRGAGADIIAEDLGTVPDFVRGSLARLGVPGFRVFRWERHWHGDGHPFREPADYPQMSVAASGTHDTEPLLVWWRQAPEDERRKVNAIGTIQRLTTGHGILAADEPTVRDVLLETLFASGSNLLLMPVQDVFGWSDRINQPATVTDDNWTFRLPWPCDRLDQIAEARERQAVLRRWTEQYGR
ncbi:MAG: 4-alpha-glucanotransferase [Acidobacteriota bacterium]